MSEKSGTENIWRMTPGATPKQVTNFTDGRVLWPAIAADGKAIVFEREFRIWKLDLSSGRAPRWRSSCGELRRTRHHAPQYDHGVPGSRALARREENGIHCPRRNLRASTKDGGSATQITHTVANEGAIAWAPDNTHILYLSDRGGPAHIFSRDFAAEGETQLTGGTGSD